MTTTQFRVNYPEDVVINLSETQVFEVFYGEDETPSERCYHIGDGVVLGRASDGEYFTASHDRDGRFVMGSSSRGEFPAEVIEALTA